MFDAIFLNVFTVALIFANVYCFIKKKYLYLFVPCMLFLPPYYGIDFTDSLPILTASRMMFIVFYVYVFINKKRNLSFKKDDIKAFGKEYWLFICYFAFRIISNLYYVTTYGQAIKTIFAIVFEQLLLLVGIYLLAPSKESIIKVMKAVVYAAAVLFVVGIFESITGIRPFDALDTVDRGMINIVYVRLGLLRATTTMQMPGLYGNMCVFMLPIIFFLYEKTRSKAYLVITGLDILAIIHSGSRSDIFFFVVVIFVYGVYVLRGKKRHKLFLKNFAVVTAALLIYMGIASAYSPYMKYFYIGSGKSVLNEFGFEFDLSEDKPSGVSGFGANPEGTVSRTRQLTGIYYTAMINPVFGLGSGAQTRGDIRYSWNHKWRHVKSYDLGVVEIFCDEGLLGLLGVSSLLLFMMLRSKKNRFYQLAIFSYLLGMASTANMYHVLMLFLILFSDWNEKFLGISVETIED